jgi:hypothetical protein
VSNEQTPSSVVAAVDQQWLSQVSPWLSAGDVPAITILPRRIKDGKAIYSDDLVLLVKQLRIDGIDAKFLETPDQAFESQYSAVSIITLNILLNIASSVCWDGFKLLLGKMRSKALDTQRAGGESQCKMSIGLVKHPDGSSFTWQEISGPTVDVLKVAESLARDYIAGSTGAPELKSENGASPDQTTSSIPE